MQKQQHARTSVYRVLHRISIPFRSLLFMKKATAYKIKRESDNCRLADQKRTFEFQVENSFLCVSDTFRKITIKIYFGCPADKIAQKIAKEALQWKCICPLDTQVTFAGRSPGFY